MVTEQKEYDVKKKRGAIDVDLGTDYKSVFSKISNMLKEDEEKFKETKEKAAIREEIKYVKKAYKSEKAEDLGLDKNSSPKKIFLGLVTYSDKITKEGHKLTKDGKYEQAFKKYDEALLCLDRVRGVARKYMANEPQRWKMLEKRFIRLGNDMVYIAEHQKDKSVKAYLTRALNSFNDGSYSLGERRRILKK